MSNQVPEPYQYPICPICQGFGKVYPKKPDGKVDYSTLIYCKCQGSEAGKVASKPLCFGS